MGIVRLLGRGGVRRSTDACEREGRRAWTGAHVGSAWPVVVPEPGGKTGANEDAGQIAPDQTPVCRDSAPEETGERTS